MTQPLPALPPPSALRAVGALMLREVHAGYGRTPGGWIWSVAEPVAAIALLATVFSLAFAAPPLGHSFVLFYATGYLPFMMFADLSLKISTAVRYSRPLLAYPAVTALDAILARAALNAVVHCLVMLIVLSGVEILFDTGAQFEPAALAVTLASTIGLALGVGTLNCCMFLRFPVWERLWGIATRPLFIVSGVFFLVESVPQPWRDLGWFNPLLHLTAMMRAAAYPTYSAPHAEPAYVCGVALATLCLGLMGLRIIRKDLAHG